MTDKSTRPTSSGLRAGLAKLTRKLAPGHGSTYGSTVKKELLESGLPEETGYTHFSNVAYDHFRRVTQTVDRPTYADLVKCSSIVEELIGNAIKPVPGTFSITSAETDADRDRPPTELELSHLPQQPRKAPRC